MRTHSKETQSSLTPELALQILKEGNDRFIMNLKANRNLLQQVNEIFQHTGNRSITRIKKAYCAEIVTINNHK